MSVGPADSAGAQRIRALAEEMLTALDHLLDEPEAVNALIAVTAALARAGGTSMDDVVAALRMNWDAHRGVA
jgi:hypothetical protein